MNLFFKDSLNNILISWDKLISDVTKSDTYNPYCISGNYYEVFKHIITSLLIGKEIVILDSDFTTAELVNLTGYSEFNIFTTSLERNDFPIIIDKMALIEQIKKTGSNWAVTIFTSGTTDLPKKVSHTFESLTRFVKISQRNASNIWGFAYSPTHIAGIQLLFQALLNGNPIIRLFGLSNQDIYKEIEGNGITNISATPTFYRLLLPCDHLYPSVSRITSGGEKFDEKTINQLTHVFPYAKITNVYASTEAGTLFASSNDTFSIKPEFEHLVRVDENVLLIHQSLLGTSDVNIKEWYNTGDLVETISQNPLRFRFVSRISEMINVGGYKVNPNEVEETIRSISGIKDVRVFGKSNSVVGNIICCEVVRNDNQLEENYIRAFLQSKLQEFKIPRMILFVNELSTTRTGKIKRI